jgi:FtsP/CotA-like multicopper oxidase with cupredoxin domain
MQPKRLLFVGALAVLTAGVTTAQWDPNFDPIPAVDINPDPNIVEINLTAAPVTWQFVPGVNSQVYAYNGQIPGPLIEAKVGDTLRVHFTNNLGEDTTVHWHGVDTPASMDGSHISQLRVPDGGTFEYEFKLLTPGLKWYHPHVRTDYMVENGLYGPLLVRDAALEASLNIPGVEHMIVFDDIKMDVNTGVLDTFSEADPLENAIYQLSGRLGNVLLVNGRQASTIPNLQVPNGVPQRWFVLNVANSRFCRLDLNEWYASYPAQIGVTPYQVPSEQWQGDVWKIGGDRGFTKSRVLRPRVVEVLPFVDHFIFEEFRGILVVPGERMEVLFVPNGDDGEILPVDSWDWARGDHFGFYKPDGTIGLGDAPDDGFKDTVNYFNMQLVGPDPGGPYYEPPVDLDTNFERLLQTDVNKTVSVFLGHALPDAAGDVTLFAYMDGNGPVPMAKMTSLEAFDFEPGDTVLWEINNLAHGDHPFHTHGFAFQWFETQYIDAVTPDKNKFEYPRQRENKDTILVPARPGAKGTSRTVLRALMKITDEGREGILAAQGRWPTADSSGGFLYHCHILEHAGRGMMGFYEIFDPTDPFANLGGATADLAGGHSYLRGSGDTQPGMPFSVTLQDATPGAPSFMVVGASQAIAPLTLGFFVPFPDVIKGPFSPNAMGKIVRNFTWPTGLPAGTELFWQYATFESPTAFNVSNALRTKQL